ncbi:thioredoxin [Lactarius deliciosus]|nr:thioredoxin [Lactarius deliciosus]
MSVKPINSIAEFRQIVCGVRFGMISGSRSLADQGHRLTRAKLSPSTFGRHGVARAELSRPSSKHSQERPEHAGVEFYKVDVDDQPDISQEVGIRAMPTFAVYKDGNKVNELVGAVPAELEKLVVEANSLA